jgi:fructokinase
MILVCGEALVDFFVFEAKSGNLKTEAVLGGSPLNVAVALSRLGQKAAFCGGLSSDYFGRALQDRLVRERVDLSYCVHSDRLTTISVVATDASGHPTYAFHGEGKADRQVTEADLPANLPDDIAAITFGSYTLVVPPVADAYLALAQREAPHRVISIDPNLRPTVTPDMTEWRQRFYPFLALADIVKASEEDIEIAYGKDAKIHDIARSWLEVGASLVLVTRGAKGAIGFLKNGEEVVVPGRQIKPVDTVGAGDTFHAALVADLARSNCLSKSGLKTLTAGELRRTMNYAIAASSITCTRQGADLPTHDEVLSVLEKDAV